ncbi:MAG: RNA methyltransferase [Chloroflexi bacterium]|nr:RNA methyltransferase [Chloroflexota bacterium]
MKRANRLAHITSAANPRFKRARALLRRRGRRQHAQLLLEGARLIQDSLSAGYPPALVLFDPAKEKELAGLLAEAEERGAELASMEPNLLQQLCETATPQGVVALAPWPKIEPGHTGLNLLVDGVRDPGNLGTLIRSAAAANVDQVILLPGVTDPWSPKALRAGMGAQFRIAIRQARRLVQAEEWLGTSSLWLAAARAEMIYTDVNWTKPATLIVGGETGAQRTEGLKGVKRIAIPMARGVESLNAAVAASIILFEAVRQRRASG